MTMPQVTPPEAETSNTKLLRVAIWVAIGALIAAAVVCVIMVLLGSANGIVGRAFLTILLMVAFSGVALLDTHLAPRRPVWFALTSMVVWVVTLLIGAVMIWLPFREFGGYEFGGGAGRFLSFLLIVLILQLGVLHVRLYVKAWDRHRTTFTNIVAWVTIVLVALLALALVFPLMLREWVHFYDIYWRLTVAIAILAAVGTALVPLVNALFAPHRAVAGPSTVPQGWPTYADGVTPLPVLPDGQPDWNAYYTGYPTQAYQGMDAAPAAPAPAAPPAPAPPAPAPPAQAWPAPEPAPAIAPEPTAAPRPYIDPYAMPAESDWPAPAPAPQPQAPQPPAAPGYGDYPPPPPLPGQR